MDTVPRRGIARLYSQPSETGVTFQSSDDLINWTTDTGAIIDIPAGTIHASPDSGIRERYFRLNGTATETTIQHSPIGENRFFFEVR